MDFWKRELVFKRARTKYQGGDLRAALKDFRFLIEDGSTDPRHISYFGLLIAIIERKAREGLILCERAVERGFYDTEMYLNLATLHFRTGKRNQAKEVLLTGLRMYPKDPALLREISRLNPRSTPPLPFLSRNHPLNKYLGLARAHLFHRAA